MFELTLISSLLILLLAMLVAINLRGVIGLLWIFVLMFGMCFQFLGSDTLMIHSWVLGTLMVLVLHVHTGLMGDEAQNLNNSDESRRFKAHLISGGVIYIGIIFLFRWFISSEVNGIESLKNEALLLGRSLIVEHGVLTLVLSLVMLLSLVGLAEDRV